MWTGTFICAKSQLSHSSSALARISIGRLNHVYGNATANSSNINRALFSTSSDLSSSENNNDGSASTYSSASGLLPPEQYENSKRVWLPKRSVNPSSGEENSSEIDIKKPYFWKRSVDETDFSSMRGVIDRIGVQEREGGRMRERKLGVLREDPKEDMRLLVENYTVPALASALRDREDVLQLCATLLAEQKMEELSMILRPFERKYVERRRLSKINLDLTKGFDSANIQQVRKGLNRMPRRVSQAHSRRAGVVLPLCNVNGVPCVLFEKRSAQLRAHADEVCLPGGMVSAASDKSIVATCLREMDEEIEGIGEATVLGVLRCNWGEVHHLVGVAVTPVVCYIGEIGDSQISPNSDEVAEAFTVPLSLFLDQDRWVHRRDFAPTFTGGPHVIWGLTGYIMNRFVKDVLATYNVQCPSSGPKKWLP